ncbi:TonB-dependent receptor [Amphiplicatus metriothermophilus]|uniref:Catecholate siderophore receptor n=1 Tax=Amphiplicatus metriothermophilus TaxID=1519374 RepID=A0A239PSX3_9PROT|nr:TonB-dependent siderophore receptor [Amphiplicatus metriothermophilus]MBB5519315.1 catecholate siderophore receptor [Amphiplicatus metriothermophilus]SNT73384.1 catecholate siderophore receptor [Amphiplicatus metriothermophilus]
MKHAYLSAAVSAAALIAAGAPAGASAQEDSDGATPFAYFEDTITVIGKRSNYGLDAVASATKTDTPLVDIPQSLTVISRDLIDDQDMRSLADVVRYTPGVTMGQGEGHRDAPTLRGNSTTADFYVDGVRDDVQYFRELYNLERVEVIKGPNALIFGRGGGGGVINRVTKKAEFEPVRSVTLSGGQFGSGRVAGDIGAGVSDTLALRLNAFYENSDSYRDFVGLERFGINPTGTVALGENSALRLSYEYFSDERTVDRGVPSQNGRPFAGDRKAFFGNPDLSFAEADVHRATAAIEHEFAPNVTLRNNAVFAYYDKFYQNVHARSPVDANGDVQLQAYFSSTERKNFFNQTDLVWKTETAGIGHTLLLGAEFGVQDTDNFRTENNNNAGVVNIADPTTFDPATFEPARNDNNVDLTVASVYLQDQIALTDRILLIGGVRFDHFDLEFDDNRPDRDDFSRTDDVVSPRGGIIYKPLDNASVYFSYSKSFLPQSGDQFGSLSATTAALKPEEFENLEIGVKWDITPELAFTAAVYRLDRENTRAIDPDTNQTVLTGAQRSKGVEIGLAGALTERWEVMAGYAWQDAEIRRDTAAAPAGREAPLVPEHAFSLWNKYQFTPRFAVGLGVVHQSDMFASISNAVTLPGFTRLDAALFYSLNDRLSLQVNVENITDKLYFPTAHNDNNITPGAPVSARATLKARF